MGRYGNAALAFFGPAGLLIYVTMLWMCFFVMKGCPMGHLSITSLMLVIMHVAAGPLWAFAVLCVGTVIGFIGFVAGVCRHAKLSSRKGVNNTGFQSSV